MYALIPERWPNDLLSAFSSQYGCPTGYPILQRAKLLGSFGITVRMLDEVQKAVIAPYMEKGKSPKGVLPNDDATTDKPRMPEDDRKRFDEMLGINRHGKKE